MSGFVFFFFLPPVVPADARSFALVFTGAQPSAGTCASVSGTSLPHETRDTYTDHLLRPAAAASRHRAISCQCLSLRIRDSCLSCAVAPGCAQVAPGRAPANQANPQREWAVGLGASGEAANGRQTEAGSQRIKAGSQPHPQLGALALYLLSYLPTYLLWEPTSRLSPTSCQARRKAVMSSGPRALSTVDFPLLLRPPPPST